MHSSVFVAGDCCVFKFLRRNMNGEHLMRFQSKKSVFKFLRCSVDGILIRLYQSHKKELPWNLHDKF